jgi:taurine dioxygenase
MATAARDLGTKQGALRVKRHTPAIGGVVEGVDLSQQLDDATIAEIRRALDEHLVLFFENQHVTEQQQRDFSARFGDMYTHPVYPTSSDVRDVMLLEYDETRRGNNDSWHSDVTYIETPPQASVLYSVEIPEEGGDTLWLNAYLAYESLPAPLQRLARDLRASHSFAKAFTPDRFRQYGIEHQAGDAYAANPPVSHPVVRTNAQTGRKALFVNPTFTTHIEGVSRKESAAILAIFFDHLYRPEHQMRWRWQPNTVAFWDNRWTQHFALADYFPNRRRMRRVTILGDRPT